MGENGGMGLVLLFCDLRRTCDKCPREFVSNLSKRNRQSLESYLRGPHRLPDRIRGEIDLLLGAFSANS